MIDGDEKNMWVLIKGMYEIKWYNSKWLKTIVCTIV